MKVEYRRFWGEETVLSGTIEAVDAAGEVALNSRAGAGGDSPPILPYLERRSCISRDARRASAMLRVRAGGAAQERTADADAWTSSGSAPCGRGSLDGSPLRCGGDRRAAGHGRADSGFGLDGRDAGVG